MNGKIFFSYSWKDIPIAMRVYSDLVRNGLVIWRDEFSASTGAQYADEIGKALKECNALILLDSKNSRNSRYVRDECQVLSVDKEWVTGKKKIIVCLVDEPSVVYDNPELFMGLNGRKYINFSNTHKLFDNDRAYLTAITELCGIFGVSFSSSYPDTSEKDFEDELSMYSVKDIDRTILLKEFESIQMRLTNGYPHTLERLEFFNNECESLKLTFSTPLLQLAIEHSKIQQYDKAKDILNVYTKIYSDDPRGWRVFAGALFELEYFELALFAYDKTIELSEEIALLKLKKEKKLSKFGSEKNLDYLLVSRINRGTTLFSLGRFDEALNEYELVLNNSILESQLLPEHFAIVIDAYDKLSMEGKRENLIEVALIKYPGDFQLNLCKARYLFETGYSHESIKYYEYLIKRDIQDLKVFAEYFSILKTISHANKDEVVKLYEDALSIKPISPEDLYYYGYILFLKGEIENSKTYFSKSKYLQLPSYECLWKN